MEKDKPNPPPPPPPPPDTNPGKLTKDITGGGKGPEKRG